MNIHHQLLQLRQKEKLITGEILEKLQLLEDNKEYLDLGHSSLFDYLVRALGYSEATAYQRQACVRLSREVPEIKDKIEQGTLTVSAVTVAYKHLRRQPLAEKRKTLQSLENKSTREVKKLFLEPALPLKVKKTEYREKVHLRLELSHEQHEKLKRLKNLKSHKHNLESLFEELIDKELRVYEKTDFKPSRSTNPRCVSKRLRNYVLKRAEYKCQHRGCEQTQYLQIDHVIPVRQGGRAVPENLQVLCSAHNRYKG